MGDENKKSGHSNSSGEQLSTPRFNEISQSLALTDAVQDLTEILEPSSVDFEISEDTALLIDNMNNPFNDLDPANFNEEQKQRWMQRFEENIHRFSFEAPQFNMYGQRQHPGADPYAYQHVGPHMFARQSTSVRAINGEVQLDPPPVSYEVKY